MGLRSSAFFVSMLFIGITLTNVDAQCSNNNDCPENYICDNGSCINPDPVESAETIEDKSEYLGGSSDKNEIDSKTKQVTYNGFTSGTQFITPGFLGYGNSLIGVEYEFGLNRVVGLQVGGGFVGAEFGTVIHLIARSNFDMHLIADGNVIFGLGVLPGISLGMRGLFGKAARVGVLVGKSVCRFVLLKKHSMLVDKNIRIKLDSHSCLSESVFQYGYAKCINPLACKLFHALQSVL